VKLRAGLRSRTYQDGVGEQVAELLSEFFVLWSKHIAFPELSKSKGLSVLDLGCLRISAEVRTSRSEAESGM
jgi:hypothetical protein